MARKCKKETIAYGGEGNRTVAWHRQTNSNWSETTLLIFNFQGASPTGADQKLLWMPLDKTAPNHSNDRGDTTLSNNNKRL